MNVFVVTVQMWDDVEIREVFSTFEKAQDFCGTLSDVEKVNATINIFEVK